MRVEDAPPAGWYPDPRHGTRLRYWDGLDWTEDFLSRPPGTGTVASAGVMEAVDAATRTAAGAARTAVDRADMERVISEVRQVARSEVERAADLFSQRAQRAARDFQPLVTEYVGRFTRWLRWLAVLIVLAVVAYFVFQAIGVASVLDWIGDRIDSLSDDG